MSRFIFSVLFGQLFFATAASEQSSVPIEEWTDRTILLVGAHPDDDHQSHGTLAMLNDHDNDVYILTMTTGNVGTKDPNLSTFELSSIRLAEQLGAMLELGLGEEKYINLGYDDGRLEFADREEVVGKLVYYIRKLKPDVIFAFDPGFNYQVWQKSDHRAAGYLAADAIRAAEWRLMYPSQIIHDGLEAHLVEERVFFGGNIEDKDLVVNISNYADKRIAAGLHYISQWSTGWDNYLGPDLDAYGESARQAMYERVSRRIVIQDGKKIERFRYHNGSASTLGHEPRD